MTVARDLLIRGHPHAESHNPGGVDALTGAAPSGPAGGDLAGSFPNPTVISASGSLAIKGPRPWIDVRAYGAVGDGVTDDLAAFDLAMAAVGSIASPVGAIIFVPYSVSGYRLSGPWNITRECQIWGTGSAQGYGIGTRLVFDAGVHGVIFVNSFAGNGRSDGSVLRGFAIEAVSKSGTTHGITIQANQVAIYDCRVANWSGDGIHIVAAIPATNANNWKLSHINSLNNGGHGVFVQGNDSNGGMADTIDASGNGGWGIWDDSFLGNTYVGCHTSFNTLGAYKASGGVADCLFVGCYAESPQLLEIRPPSLWLGGTVGGGFSNYGGGVMLGALTGFRFHTNQATTGLIGFTVQGEAGVRWQIFGSGAMQWGDGTNPADTFLDRPAANFLRTTGTLQVGGILRFGDGTAAAPSLAVNSDLATGIYKVGAGEIGIAVAGADALRIASFGGAPQNYFRLINGNAGGPVELDAAGIDTNIGVKLAAKGTGGVLVTGGSGGLGYGTGTGGAVTQITSPSTPVTLNKPTGQITTVALTTAAGANERFRVNNSIIAATDAVGLGTTYNGAGLPLVFVLNVTAGGFDIVIKNEHATVALNALMVINFAVLKAIAA